MALKEHEIQQFIKDHAAPEDDLQMALRYYEITPNYDPFKKLARAFRRTPAAALYVVRIINIAESRKSMHVKNPIMSFCEMGSEEGRRGGRVNDRFSDDYGVILATVFLHSSCSTFLRSLAKLTVLIILPPQASPSSPLPSTLPPPP